MPPIPAIGHTNTPDSLVDKENGKPSQTSVVNLKVPLTEPHSRNPLQSRDLNRATPHNAPLPGSRSVSAPDAGKRVEPLKVPSSSKGEEENVKRIAKRPKTETANRIGANEKSSTWKYKNNKEGVAELLKKLCISDAPNDIQSTVELFRFLEKEGRLSPEGLKIYSHCPDIRSVMMGPSYGGQLNSVGLLEPGNFSAFNCTVPFFHGFANLIALDLTCVPIEDEEIRYLIKLEKLQALGLSGTKITGKSLRYLAKHATFTKTLQCIKLCYLDKLEDSSFHELAQFPFLSEIDLFGSNKVTLNGVVDTIFSDFRVCCLKKIRIPEKAFSQLQARHISYSEVCRNTDVIDNSDQIDQLPIVQIQTNLRIYRKLFPDIFLNLEVDSLKLKLQEILARRKKEEFLWSVCQ